MKRPKYLPRFDKNLYKFQYNVIVKAVDSHFNDMSKTTTWMSTVNPLLGNFTPVQMLKLGRYTKLLNFVFNQLQENKL